MKEATKYQKAGKYRWTDFLPSVDNLWKLNIVLREYLALGWYNLRGKQKTNIVLREYLALGWYNLRGKQKTQKTEGGGKQRCTESLKGYIGKGRSLFPIFP
jgi:hypothetical protein